MNIEILENSYILNIFYTALTFLVLYFISGGLKKIVNSNVQDLRRRHRFRKNAFYSCVFVFIIISIAIWTTALSSITAILSFVGAGIALALHEVILCFAGWIVINLKKPFEVGERIEGDTIRGDVIDINVFHTVMIEVGNWVQADQSTGRIVTIPNSFIFRRPIYNYTKEFAFIWHEIPIMVTFESDYEKARELILNVAMSNAEEVQATMDMMIKKMSDHYMVQYKKLTPVVYTRIVDSGVLLTLRYLTSPQKRRNSEDIISRKILDVFNTTPAIDFAYPTTRFYQQAEQK
jgi:small-conductance mechanosensitive channel